MSILDKPTGNARPQSQSPEISFRPLSEGLGFHPFSDGLPYAPIGKNARPTPAPPSGANAAAGATAAGLPQVAHSPTGGLRRTEKTIPQISVPVAKKEPQWERLPASEVQSPQKVQKPQKQELPIWVPGYGYLFKRAMAYIFDVLANTTFCLGVLAGFMWIQDVNLEILLNTNVVLVIAMFLFVLNWILITGQELTFRTTLGKRLFRLAMPGTGLAIWIRAILFLPSAGLCGIGLLWGLVDSRKRCWHDLLSQSQPIEINRR